MAAGNWVNIGSGNGLLPDDTKPLPEPMSTFIITKVQWCSSEGNFAFYWNLPGANELNKIQNASCKYVDYFVQASIFEICYLSAGLEWTHYILLLIPI